jgi:hypothetical protein
MTPREPLTAEDVTDEMVRGLREEMSRYDEPPYDFECPGGRPSVWVAACDTALDAPLGSFMRRSARTRIARLLNARRGK